VGRLFVERAGWKRRARHGGGRARIDLENLDVEAERCADDILALDEAVERLPTSPSGTLTLPFNWPSGVPAGLPLYFQFWISDPGASLGLAAGNGLKGVSM